MKSYRKAMRSFADMTNLDVWYAQVDVEQQLPEIKAQTHPKRAKELEKALAKVRTRDSMQAFTKLTEEVDGEPRIVSKPPLIVPLDELLEGTSETRSSRVSSRSLVPTARPSRPTADTCWTGSGTSRPLARWSVWGASARKRGSC